MTPNVADIWLSKTLATLPAGPDPQLAPGSPYVLSAGVVYYRLTPAVWAWFVRTMERAAKSPRTAQDASGEQKPGSVSAEAWEAAQKQFRAVREWVEWRYTAAEIKTAFAGRPSLPAVGCQQSDAELDRLACAYRFPVGVGPTEFLPLPSVAGERKGG